MALCSFCWGASLNPMQDSCNGTIWWKRCFQSTNTWVGLTKAVADNAFSKHQHLGGSEKSPCWWCSIKASTFGCDWPELCMTTLFQSIDTWVGLIRALGDDPLSEDQHLGVTDQSPWWQCSFRASTFGSDWPEPLATALFQSIDTWVWLTRALGDDALSEHRHLGVTDQSHWWQRLF